MVADAGPFQTVARESQVTLDGGRSLAAGAVPTFSWVLTERPLGSAATLDAADVPSPTFVADRIGRYRARLVVRDGTRESEPSFTEVRAQAGSPTGPRWPR